MRDNTVQGMPSGSLESLEGHSSLDTCLNGTNEEFIDIFPKSRCQWSGCSIQIELGQERYGHLNPQGP